MFYRRLLLPLLLWFSMPSFAQSYIGLREVISYNKQTYNAGAQNWNILQDAQGRMYFANNEGLLCFDGVYWKLTPLANKTILRSIVFGEDGRIYAGGQDEIGYFSPDNTGNLIFTSLKALVPEADQKFADIWEIVQFGKDIFFRSSTRIIRYSQNKMTVYRSDSYWYCIGISGKRLIAQDQQLGLMEFSGNRWLPLIAKQDMVAGFEIMRMADLGQDSTLLTTAGHGLYMLNSGKLQPFLLSGMKPDPRLSFSCVIPADNEHFVLGTYNNGFYLVSDNGEVVENFSSGEGLQNANIRSICIDRNSNIWLGLDSGIDFIAFNNAIKHINPAVMNGGAGYAVLMQNQHMYFGASNGIYALPVVAQKDMSYLKADFRPIATGQTWGLALINNMVFAGRDEGFFRISGEQVSPISLNRGFWTFEQLQHHQSSLIVAGNYEGIKLFEANGNAVAEKGSVKNFNESARYLVIDNDNTIWISHPYRGVYRIQLSGNADANVKLYNEKNGLPSSLNNHVYKIKNRVVIATAKGIFEYNIRNDSFETSAYFKDIFEAKSIRYLKEDINGNVWFIQEKNMGVVDFSSLQPSIIYLPELKGKMLSGFEHIYPVNENNIFVGGEKGFYHINFEKYKNHKPRLDVHIRSVKSIGRTDSLLFGGYAGNINDSMTQSAEAIPNVTYQNNSFHIEYSSPLFEQEANLEYSYYLEGFDKDWSEWSKKSEKDYTNLSAGSYSFKVKVRNNLRDESTPATFSFSVSPPWYKSILARVFYGILALWIVFLLYRKQQHNLIRERQKHAEEQKRLAYLHQLEIEKSEKELVKLKNEKLETEIEFKNSELATTAMHLVQKGEFLVKIKDELQHLNKPGKDKSEAPDVKKILRILSEEEKLNEEWEQFSVHFDKVHSDFLITLKEKYPDLRAHELKLCAYLRMNLSSKEIAQLMSISVRGVEISRYRLRKKLKIPTETNLFQFLFDIQRDNFTNQQST